MKEKKLVEPPAEWDCGIIISDIRKSGEPRVEKIELKLGGTVEYWGQSYAPSSPLRALVTADWTNGGIVIRVELDCKFRVSCYRCLEETGIAIKGDMRYIFSLRQSETSDEKTSRSSDDDIGEPDGAEEIISIDPQKADIDMAPYIWETMILNLPQRVLCVEECKGLCIKCGSNRNEAECACTEDDSDPRLEVLKKLM